MSYLYLIDSQNRGDLVEEIFKKRKEWKPIKYEKNWKSFYNQMKAYKWNLIWKPTVNNIYDKKLFSSKGPKFINHFPNPDVITRKTNLLTTLNKHSKDFNYLPETYIFPESLSIFEENIIAQIIKLLLYLLSFLIIILKSYFY